MVCGEWEADLRGPGDRVAHSPAEDARPSSWEASWAMCVGGGGGTLVIESLDHERSEVRLEAQFGSAGVVGD